MDIILLLQMHMSPIYLIQKLSKAVQKFACEYERLKYISFLYRISYCLIMFIFSATTYI